MTMYSAVAPTSYDVGSGIGTYVQSLALQNSSVYNVRVARVDYVWGSSGSGVYVDIARYEGSSISGGTSFAPLPLRQGAVATAVTCRSRVLTIGSSTTQGSAVTVTGTQKLLTKMVPKASELNAWEPPADLLLSPGSALYLTSAFANATGTNTYFINAIIYFEEIQEDWTT